LTALVQGSGASRRAGVEAKIAETKAALFAKAEAAIDASPMDPMAVLKRLGEVMPDDAIIIEELLSSGMNTVRQLLPATRPDSWFGMRGGGIGVALPQAAAIQLANPGRPVVALTGDGSLMYSAAALWTCAHYMLPVVTIVFNNSSYRILKQRTRAIGDHSAREGIFVAMDLEDPPIDFMALATAHGVQGVRVESIPALIEAFKAALASDAPTLIEVPVARAP
jgi:benzoylformate decarboxylase